MAPTWPARSRGSPRDGDTYVLNGSKMWSTGAAQADWGMCLARTDWDVPKHRGLSMIAVPLKGTPGVMIEPIRQVTGVDAHFCQEFFDDVVLPAENLIGAENDGWAVAQTLLGYERLATTGSGHGYGLEGRAGQNADEGFASISNRAMIAAAAARAGTRGDAGLRALVAESNIERTVARYANRRIMAGMRTRPLHRPVGFAAQAAPRRRLARVRPRSRSRRSAPTA